MNCSNSPKKEFTQTQAFGVYITQVARAAANASDESQADLLKLANRIPNLIKEWESEGLTQLFQKLTQYAQNSIYDPDIAKLANEVLQKHAK
jgi:hypothetical protein